MKGTGAGLMGKWTNLEEHIEYLIFFQNRDQIVDCTQAMGRAVSQVHPSARVQKSCKATQGRGARGLLQLVCCDKQRHLDLGRGSGVLTSSVASLDDNDLLHLSILVSEYDPATTGAIRKLKAGSSSDEEGGGHQKESGVKQRLGLEYAPSEVTVAVSDVCYDLLDLVDVIPHDFDHV